jgi:imidazolonepropionase-like amidohydrolase
MLKRVSTAALATCLLAIAPAALAAPHHPAPVAKAPKPAPAALATPPADAEIYAIVSSAGTHGYSDRWITRDGRHMSRETWNLRGQKFDVDTIQTFGADGMPASLTVHGTTPSGDAGETFAIAKGHATWKSQIDSGEAAYTAPAYYLALGGTMTESVEFYEALLKAPGQSLDLLPGGKAHAEKLIDLTIGDGPLKKTVTAWAITGISNTPFPVWMTQDGHFFGTVGGISLLPKGYEGSVKPLTEAQTAALGQQAKAIAHRFLKAPGAPIAIVHVETFDADHQLFLKDQTVVVSGGKITATGAYDSTTVPADAQVIAGNGLTLVPGLWDSHQHVGDDFSGPMLLSMGVTSARDPGNDNDLTIDRAKRRAGGDLLMPKVYPSSLIDGKGPNSAQLGTVVATEAEGVAAVDKAKADGFVAIKFYGSLPKDYVKPLAAEAHKLGLHVHGHVPAGMRPSEAIADGYDEITHIYFVMMEAMPDSVVAKSNGIARLESMGMYAKDVDLNAAPMKGLIAEMGEKKITSDPTLVVVEGELSAENGEMSPAYAPFVGTLPPATERGFRAGGLQVAPGYTRADYRAGVKKLGALVMAMHKAGVPIVAGTDGSGIELIRELELYVDAGFTPAEALETATLNPARLQHVDGAVGSIAVGKNADLVLVEGDPSQHIGDLRHTRMVMMDGIPMDTDALRTVSGFSGRPK